MIAKFLDDAVLNEYRYDKLGFCVKSQNLSTIVGFATSCKIGKTIVLLLADSKCL